MIKKAKIIYLDTKIDDRGYLYQIYDFDFECKIKRIYQVGNFNTNTIRGMHFHQKEWKYFFVSQGSIKFVISPDKKDGKNTQVFILSSKKPGILVIPPKLYNGWVALEKNTILLGLSSFTLSESLKDDLRIDPQDFIESFSVKSR